MTAPRSFAWDYSTKPFAGSCSGANYRTASGNTIAKWGGDTVMMKTSAGHMRMSTLHIADITKPLALLGSVTNRVHRIVLGDGDAYAQHRKPGKKVRGNDVVMNIQVMALPRDGEPARNQVEVARIGPQTANFWTNAPQLVRWPACG